MNVAAIEQDKELAALLAAKAAVPAEAEAARARLDGARERFEGARGRYRTVAARASLGHAKASEAKAAERAADEAADALRKAEDEVEILSEKVSVLATAIAQARAARRLRILPDVKAEGNRIAREAAEAFAVLARLAGEARALKGIIDGDFLVDVTAGGFGVYAKEIAELGSAPRVAAMLAGRSFAELTLEKWARVSK